jgi:hypothetical protein
MSARYALQDGIPCPVKGERASKYPFHRMKVGESFLVPHDDAEPVSVRNAAYSHGTRHNKRFSCHTERAGVRVWRVA